MKLFFYYVFHSAKNALKKLFKTWVLVFFVVMLAGGLLVGTIVGLLVKNALPEEPGIQQEEPDPGEAEEPDPQEMGPRLEILELAAGGVILAVFALGVFNADKSGAQIFQPADVTLLFSSPLKPQSVLLFRTMTQIGSSLIMSLYLMIYQLPRLTENAGLSFWILLAILLGWGLTLAVSQLIKMLCFVAASTRPAFKRNLRRFLYIFLLALAGGFYLFKESSGLDWWEASRSFFNAPISRYIPFWGWIKGFVMFSAEGKLTPALILLGAVLLGCGILAFITWRMKADFYEEALQKASEKAEIMEAAQGGEGGIIQRKKDRSERIRRNELNHGWGASVYLHKALYNRRRFAHLGIFTKTFEFYLVAALGMALLCRFLFETDSPLPLAGLLALCCFLRSLGNSLRQDTQMWYFHLIPENSWAKLLGALGGDMIICLMDIWPALIIGLLIQGTPLLPGLFWGPAIVSISAYSTSVGAFIDLSVNVNAGKTLKNMIQVIFVDFGLLPDLLIAGVMILLGLPLLAMVVMTGLNLALSALFLFFASLALGRG